MEIYMAWFGIILAALFVAAIHLARKRVQGVVPALAAITGALLTWAFVSAYIGAFEIDGYVKSGPFAVSLAVGTGGVALFAWSCIRLKRTLNKGPEPTP